MAESKYPFIDLKLNGRFARVFSPDADSSRVTLLLPGFPGEETRRNEDLAAYLGAELNRPTHVIHYAGLGDNPGAFSFGRSIDQVFSHYQYLVSAGFTQIAIVGHSWGGFAALATVQLAEATATPTPSKLALLCPYASLPRGDKLNKVVQYLFQEEGQRFGNFSTQEVIADIHLLDEKFAPFTTLAAFAKRVPSIIIQGTLDAVVPLELTNQLAKKANSANYRLVEDNHLFTINRPSLFLMLRDFLK